MSSALLASCHPVPTLCVTGLATGLAALAAREASTAPRPGAVRRVLTWGATVGAGQLVIGWVNDLLDAERDALVGRADKPIAAGRVERATVWRAAAGATAASALLGGALGPRTAAAHLGLVVAPGVAHSLGVKRTVLSPLPYALAFGALPVLSAAAGRGRPVGVGPGVTPLRPALAGASLGVAAHLVNAARDIADDERTGQAGLPARLGAPASHGAAGALVGVAAAVARGPLRLAAAAGAAAILAVGRRAG